MEFWRDVSGKTLETKLCHSMNELEQVYTAFATRMIEILDKEERLQETQERLNRTLASLDRAQLLTIQQDVSTQVQKVEQRLSHSQAFAALAILLSLGNLLFLVVR